MGNWWNGIGTRVTEVFGEKPLLLLIFLPQIPHGLAWDRSRALAFGGGCAKRLMHASRVHSKIS